MQILTRWLEGIAGLAEGNLWIASADGSIRNRLGQARECAEVLPRSGFHLPEQSAGVNDFGHFVGCLEAPGVPGNGGVGSWARRHISRGGCRLGGGQSAPGARSGTPDRTSPRHQRSNTLPGSDEIQDLGIGAGGA